MMVIGITGIPATAEQAVETLIEFYVDSLPEILTMSLQEFADSTHYGAGLFIRNSWCLWWHEGHNCDTWPKEKPALVKYFNDLDIVYSNHRSSILMVSFYLKVHNLPLG